MDFNFDPSFIQSAVRKAQGDAYIAIGEELDLFWMLDELLLSNRIVTQGFGEV